MSGNFALWCMQVPATMDLVLLEWGGGESVVLARFGDVHGVFWLSYREVYKKLGGIAEDTWHKYTRAGEHTSWRLDRVLE